MQPGADGQAHPHVPHRNAINLVQEHLQKRGETLDSRLICDDNIGTDGWEYRCALRCRRA